MPNFGSHLSGPVKHAAKAKNRDRGWFSNQPVGGLDPEFVTLFYDFEKVTEYSTTDFTYSSSGTGTSAAVNTSSNAVNGALLLTTGSTAGNYASAQSKVLGWQLSPVTTGLNMGIQDSKALWYEASFTADVTATDINLFVGLSETAADTELSANYIGFQVDQSASTIKFVSCTASAVAAGTTSQGSGNSVTLVQGTQVKVGFAYSGSNVVDFYINRNYMNSVTLASIPTCPLAIVAQIRTSGTASRTMTLDYVYVAKTR